MQSTVKKNCSLSYLALFPKGKKDFFFIVKVLLYGSLERKKTVFFIFLPFLHISKHFGPHRSFGLHILLSQPKILNFLNKKKNHFTHFFERKYAEIGSQRPLYSCPNDMNGSALERGGLGATFKVYYRFLNHLNVAVS